MGATTEGLVVNDISSFKKALTKFSKKNGLELELTSSRDGYLSVAIKPLGRFLTAATVQDVNGLKELLPKQSRKLKNAKSMIRFSLGKDAESQRLIMEILKCHDNHGYILLNDCGHGKYIEVNEKGLVTPNLTKKQPTQILALRRYYNDFPVEIPTISIDEALNIDVEDIIRVYVDKNPEVSAETKEANGRTTSSVYYSDLIIVTYKSDTPYFVSDECMYGILANRHIFSTPQALRFISKIPKGKITYTQGIERCSLFPA